jgi:hypothetical protein
MGGILASANLDVFKSDGFWKNCHVAILLLTLGGVAVAVPSVWYWCVSGQVLIIGSVWKLKLVLPDPPAAPGTVPSDRREEK